jgi:hypothetical protein
MTIKKNLVGFWLLKISHQYFKIFRTSNFEYSFLAIFSQQEKGCLPGISPGPPTHPLTPLPLAQGLYADWSWAGLSRVYQGYQYGY